MRQYKLKLVENYIALFRKLSEGIGLELSRKDMDLERVRQYLETCQQKAIELGTYIEESEGLGHVTVSHLETFCEDIFQIFEEVQSERGLSAQSAKSRLDTDINRIEESANKDIKREKLVVFLPYKASMWDSLESVWKKADAEENTTALVIPIPYFDKNPDGSVKEEHYEGDQYPDYVPITSYEDFDFGMEHPDEIYIHNPYDDMNYVTSVHPFFYSEKLKDLTEKLVYIPYFVLGEPDVTNPESIENMAHFVITKGVLFAHEVIVQSENMKKAYVEALVTRYGEETRPVWEAKIKGTGSPKFDKILSMKEEEQDIPKEWLKVIEKPDGSHKKIVFYNTSVVAMLNGEEQMLEKIKDVLQVFKENKDDVALLWRPHPLVVSTLESMLPELAEKYKKIVAEYKAEGWGIFDETADMDKSIVISDAYYGDPSSIVQLYEKLEKPIMIQNPEILNCENA